MGDALAHAALPGVCIAFLFAEWGRARGFFNVGSKNLWLLLLGASATGLMAAGCVSTIARHTKLKEDAAQAIVLTVFFGAGVVFLTQIQHSGAGSQSGLDKFLFGQTASLVLGDVQTMAVVAIVLCLLSFALFKELKLLCFDREFAMGIGLPMARLDALLMVMIVAAVVIGLQAVGVVLISALLITPPAAARFWTDRLNVMVVLSALIGGASGLFGTILSALPGAQGLPTGPTIVLAATALFFVSFVFAPSRGALARVLRQRSNRALLKNDLLLSANDRK